MENRYEQFIDGLYNTLKSTHPDLFRNISENELDLLFNNLKIISNNMSESQFKLELAKIISKIKDSHTAISFEDDKPAFEIKIVDGKVYIIQDFKDSSSSFLFSEITHINGMPINSVIQEIIPFLSIETEEGKLSLVEKNILSLELLKGIMGDQECNLTLNNDGKVETMNYTIYHQKETETKFKDIPPLSDKMDTELKIFYMKYLSCENKNNEKEPYFKETFKSYVDFIINNNIQDVIIDLRGNHGGNSSMFSEYFYKELLLDQNNNKRNYFVLTDEHVFSSATIALTEMLNLGSLQFGTIPSGEREHFGYVKFYKQDDVNLQVGYSTRYCYLDQTKQYIERCKDTVFEGKEMIKKDFPYCTVSCDKTKYQLLKNGSLPKPPLDKGIKFIPDRFCSNSLTDYANGIDYPLQVVLQEIGRLRLQNNNYPIQEEIVDNQVQR